MDLRFLAPTLRNLDSASSELLVTSMMEGERPPQGVVGLVDWRLAGTLSRLVRDGFLTGELGEVFLLPTRPRLVFEKTLVVGAGPRDAFTPARFRQVVSRILDTLEGLRVRSALVQLPGRHLDLIAPAEAADILLECAATRMDHDLWTLLEGAEGQRAIQAQLVQERRRVRSG